MKPHKHAELIKAWADGAEIERYWTDSKTGNQFWLIDNEPMWEEWEEYRIKPDPETDPEPKVETEWMYIYCNAHESKTWISPLGPSFYQNIQNWTYMGKFEVLK